MIGGDAEQGWLILKNGDHVIGLFQGMFDRNSLTFNPGWDQSGNELDTFTDVRELQRELKERGLVIVSEADETTTGPASCMVIDPDGNPVLIDQHLGWFPGCDTVQAARTGVARVGFRVDLS